MIDGSLIAPTLRVLNIQPVALQLASLESLLGRHYPPLSPDRPALIGPLTDPTTLPELAGLLRRAYPDHAPVTLVGRADAPNPHIQPLALADLDGTDVDGPAMLYLPPLPPAASVEAFQDTVAHLRAPDGCPWDRKQTHRSLREGFLEETYEVLDALDRDDLAGLQEELGDVLLHILMQIQIAVEQGEFKLPDVIQYVNAKIVRRHPHVFGNLAVDGVEQVLLNWERIKQQEKDGTNQKPSMLNGVSRSMPALAQAQSLQRHAEPSGLLQTTLPALRDRIIRGIATLPDMESPDEQARLLGDMLFDLAHLARRLNLDAESALRQANQRLQAHVWEWERQNSN